MNRKVVVVGAGAVGSTYAYALALDGSAQEIVLVDQNRELAEGQALDLAHGMPFMPPVSIRCGEPADSRDAQLIVITAGAQQKPGETRLDLQQRNAAIMTHIMEEILAQDSQAVIVVVANPVDVLTRAALQACGWPRERVFGSGTVLDTSRFRSLLAAHCEVSAHNVHGYVLGEHGDSEMIPWSLTHVAGIPMTDYCALCGRCRELDEIKENLLKQVRNSAYHIIDYKGATYFAIGLTLVRIVGAILRNQKSVLTVSTFLGGEYGLQDVCLSVPCIVSQEGAESIVEANLTPDELEALSRSAAVLREAIGELKTGV